LAVFGTASRHYDSRGAARRSSGDNTGRQLTVQSEEPCGIPIIRGDARCGQVEGCIEPAPGQAFAHRFRV
jgi:hypothetical protein